jgi:hypothetical protein
MMNHHSNGGFRPSMPPITLPSSLYAPAFDAGGIGVAVVVHLPLPGPVLHRRRRRSDLANRGDGVLFTDSLVDGQYNEDHRHQRVAYRSYLLLYDGCCCWNCDGYAVGDL